MDGNRIKIKFEAFDPINVSPEMWSKFHTFRKLYHDVNKPDIPYTADQEYEKIRIQQNKNDNYIIDLTVVEYNQKIIGLFETTLFSENNPGFENNKDLLIFNIQLLNEYRRMGIGSKIIEKIAIFSQEFHRSNLFTKTEEQDGKEFLKALNFNLALNLIENRLYIKDVDWGMLNSWKEEAEKLNPTTKLLIFNKVPEEILESYCRTNTFTYNQAPRGNLSFGDIVITPESLRNQENQDEKSGILQELVATVEQDGTVSGLTELTKVGTNDTVLNQGLTGVLRKYRGKKLGKWLKAAQLLLVKEKYPKLQFIKTSNAGSNAPMLSINTRLGFKEHSQLGHYQLSQNELNKSLKSRKKRIPSSKHMLIEYA